MVSIDSSRGGYAERFGWCRDSMVKSYFDGLMGTGFAERESDAHWAAVRAGDYLFCAGSPVNAEAAAEYIRCASCSVTPVLNISPAQEFFTSCTAPPCQAVLRVWLSCSTPCAGCVH